jgi:hypothetical protein
MIFEVFIFNKTYWIMKFSGIPTNCIFHLSDFEQFGWSRVNNTLVSNGGQNLILRNVDKIVRSITVQSDIKPVPSYVLLFYTTEAGEAFSNSKSILIDEKEALTTNIAVHDLRLDLGNETGLSLSKLTLVINQCIFKISLSRVIAIILIFYISRFLYSLQNTPAYKLDLKKVEPSKKENVQ